MVPPEVVPLVVTDAARMARRGEVMVMGSGALAYWLSHPPSTRDVDLVISDPEGASVVESMMGELGPYHELRGVWVELPPLALFTAPASWRRRAKTLHQPDRPEVVVIVPHPHDILLAKLERFDERDRGHAQQILAEMPLGLDGLARLLAESPFRTGEISSPHRCRAFEDHVETLRVMMSRMVRPPG